MPNFTGLCIFGTLRMRRAITYCAKNLSNHLRSTITGMIQNPIDETLKAAWTEVETLTTIQINPARVKCVTLAWHTLNHALDGHIETDISSN